MGDGELRKINVTVEVLDGYVEEHELTREHIEAFAYLFEPVRQRVMATFADVMKLRLEKGEAPNYDAGDYTIEGVDGHAVTMAYLDKYCGDWYRGEDSYTHEDTQGFPVAYLWDRGWLDKELEAMTVREAAQAAEKAAAAAVAADKRAKAAQAKREQEEAAEHELYRKLKAKYETGTV